MKKMPFTAICFTLIAAATLSAAAAGNIENGKKLFNDATLGGSTNPKSCSSCHEDNDLAGAASKENLKQTINRCISGPLKGKALNLDSQEMLDLESYIQSQKKE